VDEFIRLTHDRYYEELKEYFGTTVIAFFTDEPSALGRGGGRYRDWVAGLEEELVAAGGKVEELEALFIRKGHVAGRADIVETVENETVILYRKMIKAKLREIFYARLSNWCEDHGIGLIGHPAESDDIEEELFFHLTEGDKAYAVIYNERLELGAYVAYDTKYLPRLLQWKSMKSHDYVLGLEPCNTWGVNRAQALKEGKAAILPAYSSVETDLEIGILDGAKEIQAFLKKLG